MKKLIPYFITALAPLCWAGDLVLARGLSTNIPPFTLVYFRWALAFIILFVISLLIPSVRESFKNDWPIVKESWGSLSVFSLLGISGFISLLYLGLQSTSSINGGLIQTLLPSIIAIMFAVLYGESATKTQWVGLLLCMMGAAYVIQQGDWENVKNLTVAKGDLLILIATVMYGLYSALLPKSPNIHPITFLVCIMFLGQLTMLPFFLWETAFHGLPPLTWKIALGVSYVAVFPSIVAYLCWNKGVALIGPNRAGIMVTLIPVFVAVMAIPALGEKLHSYHLVGMVTIFSGMLLFNNDELFLNKAIEPTMQPIPVDHVGNKAVEPNQIKRSKT